MSNKNIERQHHQTFEELKQIGDSNAEFWYARDLQVALDCSSWAKFKRVIANGQTNYLASEVER